VVRRRERGFTTAAQRRPDAAESGGRRGGAAVGQQSSKQAQRQRATRQQRVARAGRDQGLRAEGPKIGAGSAALSGARAKRGAALSCKRQMRSVRRESSLPPSYVVRHRSAVEQTPHPRRRKHLIISAAASTSKMCRCSRCGACDPRLAPPTPQQGALRYSGRLGPLCAAVLRLGLAGDKRAAAPSAASAQRGDRASPPCRRSVASKAERMRRSTTRSPRWLACLMIVLRGARRHAVSAATSTRRPPSFGLLPALEGRRFLLLLLASAALARARCRSSRPPRAGRAQRGVMAERA
jgi:hypothetical protein